MPVALPHTVRSAIAERLRQPAWVVLIELFIGFGWLRAVAEKLINPEWWTGDAIRSFVTEHSDDAVGWYAPIATEVWVPFADSLGFIVVVLQLVAAATLISGRSVGVGLAAGMMMNLHFVLAGAVDPSIFYLICQGALALYLLERRHSATRETLEWLNVGAVILVAATIPMVRTLHPAEVIHDPAIVLATFGALFFLSTGLLLVRQTSVASNVGLQRRGLVGPAGEFRRAGVTTSVSE